MTGLRLYKIAAVALFLGLLVPMALAMRHDGEQFYSLDDPYIHMAVAEEILRGGYGINLGEFAAPSSSILYPLLLAPLLLAGLGTLAPLLIAGAAGAAAVWLLAGLFWECLGRGRPFGEQAAVWIALPFLMAAVNAWGLPLTGMEHTLHILLVLMTLIGLSRLEPGAPVPWMLAAGILIAPLVRFEGIALSLLALVPLLRWHLGAALRLLMGLALLLGTYAVAMRLMGLPMLPSSVLVKLDTPSAVGEAGIAGLALAVVEHVRLGLEQGAGRGIAVVAALALFLSSFAGAEGGNRRWIAAIAAVAVLAHLVAGQYGWFSRYEVYAVVLALAALLIVAAPLVRESWGSPLLRGLGLVALLGAMGFGYVRTTWATPASGRNIWLQQYQMHRFATEYFRHPAAVNDLGWVSYDNDLPVLDLWGLGSELAREFRIVDRRPGWMGLLTGEVGTGYAMIYDIWLAYEVPPSWCRIAALHLDHPQEALASDEVAFYLVDPALRGEMTAALERFAPTLPAGARLEIAGCPGG